MNRLLPVKNNKDEDAKEQYKNMGIKVFGKLEDDNLFYAVKLPKGWQIKQENRLIHNLTDDKGRLRARVVWKQADWDYKAWVVFTTRFNIETEFFGDNVEVVRIVAKDQDKYLYISEKTANYKKEKQFLKQAIEWLDKNYPEWQDINAYWN